MDNFSVIYKILKYIERNMDCEEFDEEHFTAEFFNVSDTRFFFLLKALILDHYVSGIRCEEVPTGRTISIISPHLTLGGMEYLANNTMMRKAYRLAKGVKEITPGL